MRIARSLGVLAVFALLLPATSTLADGLVRDGIGAISTGRGGTNLGYSDNGAILLDNPAGMVNIEGCGLHEIGVDTLVTDIEYSDPQNPEVDGKFRAYPSPELAYIRKSADGDFAYGIGLFVPAGFGAEYDMVHPFFGSTTYKSLGMLAKVVPGVAYRLTDRLSIGATLGLAYSHAELEGPLFLQPAPALIIPADFDLLVNGATPTASVGLQYQLRRNTTLGLCYTEESRFRLDGTARADIVGFPFPVASNFDAEVDLVWPRSLGFGVKHDLCKHRRVSADVIWYDWSHAFDQLDMKLTNASNPLVASFGPTIRDSIPLDWKDTVSLRLGYEWEPTACEIWRVGYIYHDSPVPNATLSPYVDGVLEHALTLGYSRRTSNYLASIAYQYSFGPEREVGDSDIAGDDFANSTFDVDAHWLALSLLVPF